MARNHVAMNKMKYARTSLLSASTLNIMFCKNSLFVGTCSLMLIGCCIGFCCACLNDKGEKFCKDLKRRWKIALGLFIYSFALGIMIWATVEANTNQEAYDVFIIKKGYFNTMAGIILGIGFLPVILMIIVIIFVLFFIVLFVLWVLLMGFLKLLSCCKIPYSKRLYDAMDKFVEEM